MSSARQVSLARHHPCKAFEQRVKFSHKARVTMPTAKSAHSSTDPFDEYDAATNDTVDWKSSGLGSQPILELNAELRTIIVASGVEDDFYTTRYMGNPGLWYAILFGLDPHFITRTLANQQKCVMVLKQQMSIELDEYYHVHKYRQFGYTKSAMHRVLTQLDEYHTHLGHFLTDFLELNVMIITPNHRYYWLGRYDEHRVTLLLYNRGMEWGAVVHADQRSHLFSKVEPMTAHMVHMDAFDVTKQHQNLTMDATTLQKLKREIKKMKIRELQDRALELELMIVDENGKKKLKANLQEEVFIQLTGCESM
jgi:hypothetical protein